MTYEEHFKRWVALPAGQPFVLKGKYYDGHLYIKEEAEIPGTTIGHDHCFQIKSGRRFVIGELVSWTTPLEEQIQLVKLPPHWQLDFEEWKS